MSKRKKNRNVRKRNQLSVVNPCYGCVEKECATCRFQWLVDKNITLEHPGGDEDTYLFALNLLISLGPLCLACLAHQMETRKEVLSGCSDEECPFYPGNTVHITEVRLSTEPTFNVEIVKSEYRLPTKETFEQQLVQRPENGCQDSEAAA